MKAIQLNTAKADNGGSFRDAGSIVDVGDKGDQIDAKTAKGFIDDGLAVAMSAAELKAEAAAEAEKDQGAQ